MNDYKDRKYLSSTEAAKYLGIGVGDLYTLARSEKVVHIIAASGQKRFSLSDLQAYKKEFVPRRKQFHKTDPRVNQKSGKALIVNGTTQKIFVKNAMNMQELADSSIHLMVTSPPYFNAKMYANNVIDGNLGDIHDLKEWFVQIGKVWQEVFRVLQPGRKAFINIMNLPLRDEAGFRSLNLVGKTIDLMEEIGFIFKRDIVWHKTHGARAHFGTYPYPGGILINNMHEFILEFNKPNKKGFGKYDHLTKKQKEASKITKEFWLSIKNTDVWSIKPENSGGNRVHVAPFPGELPFRIIKAFTYVSETVLDPFVGSGTTLAVAADLKRDGIGYELVPEIAVGAVERLKNIQGKLSI